MTQHLVDRAYWDLGLFLAPAVLLRLDDDFATLLDAADLPIVLNVRWRAVRANIKRRAVYYAIGSVRGQAIGMHRFLLGSPSGLVSDHLNGDGLDNRRANLRATTPSENVLNQHFADAPLAVGHRPRGVPTVTVEWPGGTVSEWCRTEVNERRIGVAQ